MKYEDEVTSAADDLIVGEDRLWSLARRTYENTIGPGHVQTQLAQGLKTMEQWCADVRARSQRPFSHTTGHRYRQIWMKYGLSQQDKQIAWSEAFSDISYKPTPQAIAASQLRSGLAHAPVPARTEALQRLAADPEVTSAEVETTAVVARSLLNSLPMDKRDEVVTEVVSTTPVLRQNLIRREQDRRREAEREDREARLKAESPGVEADTSLHKRVLLTRVGRLLHKWAFHLTDVTGYLARPHTLRQLDVDAFLREATALRDAIDAAIAAVTKAQDASTDDTVVDVAGYTEAIHRVEALMAPEDKPTSTAA